MLPPAPAPPPPAFGVILTQDRNHNILPDEDDNSVHRVPVKTALRPNSCIVSPTTLTNPRPANTTTTNINVSRNSSNKRQRPSSLPANSGGRRYAEVGAWKNRGDSFLEPYLNTLGVDGQTDNPPDHMPVPAPRSRVLSDDEDLDDEDDEEEDDEDPGVCHRRRRDPSPGETGDSDTSESSNADVDKVDGDDIPPPVDLGQFRVMDIQGSRQSLNQGDESSCSSTSSGWHEAGTTCDISLLERLIRTHPVWFLPGIQRAGAFHLLQGKEEGNFIVRQSSQPSTIAISVRLPRGKGPYIEHYLVQISSDKFPGSRQLSLENSDNRFESIPQLVAHYSQCCDELPVQLTLPRAIREARNRQQLTSLALLGQEFWRYPMANPRPPDRSAADSGMVTTRSSGSNSQASSLSSLGSGNNNCPEPSTDVINGASESIVLNLAPLNSPDGDCLHSQPHHHAGSPPSSPSPSLSPLQPHSQPAFILSTFKGGPSAPTTPAEPSSLTPSGPAPPVPRIPRPTPPNTLNLVPQTVPAPSLPTHTPTLGGKTPPPPPPRWAKPALNISHDASPPPSQSEVRLAREGKRPSLDSDSGQPTSLHSSVGSLSESARLARTTSSQVTSPTTPSSEGATKSSGRGNRASRKLRTRKQSNHYQESDILESPTVYCSSSVADKASDYEDIWGPEVLSTFKPKVLRVSPPFSSPDDLSSTGGLRTPTVRSNELSERVGTPIVPDVKNRLGQVTGNWVPRASPLSPCSEQRFPDASCAEAPPVDTPGITPLTAPSPAPSPSPSPSLAPAPTPTPTLTPAVPATPTDPCGETSLDPGADPVVSKQGSPFYAEPADAIRQAAGPLPRRRNRPLNGQQPPRSQRHSDPSAFQQWPALIGGRVLERIESSEELPSMSSSADNLPLLRNSRNSRTSRNWRPKPVLPPRIRSGKISDTSWAVDSSWEFIGNDDDGSEEAENERPGCQEGGDGHDNNADRPFPSFGDGSSTPPITVQQLITQRFPEFRLTPDFSANSHGRCGDRNSVSTSHSARVSAYDNVEGRGHSTSAHHLSNQHSDNEDASTEFSEPWDTTRWEGLLFRSDAARVSPSPCEDESVSAPLSRSVSQSKSFRERLDPMLCPPRLKPTGPNGGPGGHIRDAAIKLAANKRTVFAQNIDNFIACTRESKEIRPQVVMRNMRQFMSGMKNYLVKHGEKDFDSVVEKERNKLKSNEFLNLDAILEGVMHELVVHPLRDHLYRLFVDEFTSTGAIQLLADNIQYARSKTIYELGVRARITPPSEKSLDTISHFLNRLQQVDSPLEKLENLLTCISAIFNSVKSANAGRGGVALGADDFLPLFVWVLVQCRVISAEIEAEYMWGLLHPSLLSGEGGYYLTTLSSAVHVLKNFRACSEEQSAAIDVGPIAESRSILKIMVPDELHGSIITKVLPVRPNMTTRDVCKIIAHKARITNPQDYGLYTLVDGDETLLSDTECPQDVKSGMQCIGKHCMFAYKRIDAKIAWPKNSSPPQ